MKPDELNSQLLDLAESLLDDNHTLKIRLKGQSMYPTLKPGDIGLVERCTPAELKIGDILVFKQNDILVGHRLLKMQVVDDKLVFTTKGDNCYKNDAPFAEDAFLGRMYLAHRGNKTLKMNSMSMKVRKYVALHWSKYTIPVSGFVLRVNSKFNTTWQLCKSMKQNVLLISKHSERILLINAIIAVFQGVLPFAVIVCIKLLIDHLTGLSVQSPQQQLYFTLSLILTALVFLASGVLSEIRSYFSEKLSQSVTRQIYEKLHKKHASLDLSHYENSAQQDKIHRAVQEASFRPIKIISELLTGIKAVASALFLIGMFITIRWYLIVFLIVAIIPGVIIRLRYSRKLYKLKKSQSTKEREMFYFNRILTGFPFAKELKLFGFFPFFKNRFTNVQNSLFDEKITLRKSELWLGIFSQVFAVLLIFLSLGFVSYLKMKGAISIGTVVLFFFAFQRGYSVLNDFFMSFTSILEDNTFLSDFIAFLDMPTKSNEQQNDWARFSLEKEIRVENVQFRYESSKRDALKSVNITIPAGKTVAFVGANGSGKTTLIKLLCGFYQPDSGKILFDGVDATALGQKTVCENITAVFQDFALYNLSVINNLGLGNTKTPVNLEKAEEAAHAAGIADVIARLPEGYNTLLGNLFKGGEELSIGQWQKMAIARAFYRDSPLILMDEPSSALDADSELQIINSLQELARNKTAVIISHRLSTVKWVDLIYFFHNGEVAESGTHQELMELEGKYFSLFQTAQNS